MRFSLKASFVVTLLACTACAGPRRPTPIGGAGGQRATYLDPNASAPGGGIGLESTDFNEIADKMTRSLLGGTVFDGVERPLIGVSAAQVDFGTTTMVNLDPGLFVDKIRVNLSKHAMNRMRFLDLDATGAVENLRQERAAVGASSTRALPSIKSPDFFLNGKIREQFITDPTTGGKTRYLTVTMSLVDLGRELVWTEEFEFKKQGRDDLIYN